jgi:hypothetical protein
MGSRLVVSGRLHCIGCFAGGARNKNITKAGPAEGERRDLSHRKAHFPFQAVVGPVPFQPLLQHHTCRYRAFTELCKSLAGRGIRVDDSRRNV